MEQGEIVQIALYFLDKMIQVYAVYSYKIWAPDSAGGDWELRYISRELCDCSWTFVSDGIKP